MARQEFNPEKTINYWMGRVENTNRRANAVTLARLVDDVVALRGGQRWASARKATLEVDNGEYRGEIRLARPTRATRIISLVREGGQEETWILTMQAEKKFPTIYLSANNFPSDLAGTGLGMEIESWKVARLSRQAAADTECFIWDAYLDVLEKDFPGARLVGAGLVQRYNLGGVIRPTPIAH